MTSTTSGVRADWVRFPSGTDEIRGYLATPGWAGAGVVAPAVITAHENLGVTEHRQQVTRRFAEHGFACLTVDLFSRIGGRPPQDYISTAERREKAFKAAPDEQAIPDLTAGADYLAGHPWIDGGRLAAVGFCLGGGTVLQWATETDRLRCAVVLYGIPVLPPEYRPDGVERSRIAVAGAVKVPLQTHFGGADDAIPFDQVLSLRDALRCAPVDVDFNIYPRAGHAYHDETHPNHDADAAASTWSRMMSFLRTHLE
jgi:carboxymethylenebutenolidase